MNDKTILITGGNAGIGLATALLFARQGASVAILSRRADQNRSVRSQAQSLILNLVRLRQKSAAKATRVEEQVQKY